MAEEQLDPQYQYQLTKDLERLGPEGAYQRWDGSIRMSLAIAVGSWMQLAPDTIDDTWIDWFKWTMNNDVEVNSIVFNAVFHRGETEHRAAIPSMLSGHLPFGILAEPEDYTEDQVALVTESLDPTRIAAAVEAMGLSLEDFGLHQYGSSSQGMYWSYWPTQDTHPLYVKGKPVVVWGLGNLGTGTGAAVLSGVAGPTIAQQLTLMGAAKMGGRKALELIATISGKSPAWVATTAKSAARHARYGSAGVGIAGTGLALWSVIDNYVNAEANALAQAEASLRWQEHADPAQVASESTSSVADATLAVLGLGPTPAVAMSEQPGAPTGQGGMAEFNPDADMNTQETPFDTQRVGDDVYVYNPLTGKIELQSVLDYRDDPFVGFEEQDPGWLFRVQDEYRPFSGNQDPMNTQFIGPVYKQSWVANWIRGLSEGALTRFENQAIAAGLIDEDGIVAGMPFVRGSKGTHLYNAAYAVFGIANRTEDHDWQQVLDRMVAVNQERLKKEERTFNWIPYTPPDPATFRVAAKEDVETATGRKINDWEKSMLVNRQASLHREQWNRAEDIRHEQWLAEGRLEEHYDQFGTEAGQYGQWGNPGEWIAEGGTFAGSDMKEPRDVVGQTKPQIDANARYAEFFDSKFGNEIDRKKRTDETRRKTSELMSGLQRVMGMMG